LLGALGFSFAVPHAHAQLRSAAPPASVPVMLGTRDPSARLGPGAQGQAPLITSNTQLAGPASAPTNVSAARDSHAKVNVKGLHGTLSHDDVVQIMDARQAQLDACIERSRRALRWLNGAIAFAVKVDADGRVIEIRTTASTLGHRQLEQCLGSVVASTLFPSPAGQGGAELAWGMSVAAANARSFDVADPKIMAKAVGKHAQRVFKECKIRRGRVRFALTAYLAANGRLLSVGAVPLPASANDKVDCVLEQFAKWHMPALPHSSKVSFELR
jgi:hypothetical protein